MANNYILSDSEDKNTKYKNFNQIVNTLYNEEVENLNEEEIKIKNAGSIKMEPKIYYDKFSKDMKIEFKIGKNKMYRKWNYSSSTGRRYWNNSSLCQSYHQKARRRFK